jgi:putative sterol carrier protein
MKVVYPESGVAAILGQMIEQNLKDKPDKEKIAQKLKGEKVVVEFTDQNAAATVEFKDDEIVLTNSKYTGDCAYIGTDFETMTKITAGQIGFVRTLWLLLTGKLKMKKSGVLKEFQKLL